MDDHALPRPRIPLATYRLQLNRQFRLRDAAKIVDYLDELGIGDVYLSPCFKARKGSLHGYDIVDHNALNPEIGSEKEFESLMRKLDRRGIGRILDLVPNHMSVEGDENVLWMDVLENGPSSARASYFDIDWRPVKKELEGKILLPVLGDQYGLALERGEMKLGYDQGGFCIRHQGARLPLEPRSYLMVLNHRLPKLEESLGPANAQLNELLSVITALGHLPAHTERDPEKIAERYREQEIVKRRLWNLYRSSAPVRSFINRNLEEFNGKPGVAESFDLIDKLLDLQVYRFSYWRVATDEINYRRFFDINQLAAIRVEDPRVFAEAHRTVGRMIRLGWISGLRVDHPDGLNNPREYFNQLQRECFIHRKMAGAGKARGKGAEEEGGESLRELFSRQYDEALALDPEYKPFYIIGEKILIKSEKVPEEWPIISPTGYIFLNLVNSIFIDTGHAKAFEDIYRSFVGVPANFASIVYEAKKLVMETGMASEIRTLGHELDRLSERHRQTRDYTLSSLTRAIQEVIAFFPVYRTYIDASGVKERDRRYVEQAVSKAKRNNPAISAAIFDFLQDVLLLRFPAPAPGDTGENWLRFVMKFQQLTAPVMAKGMEDTAYYRYHKLLSLNEVGGSPERFGLPLEAFHAHNLEWLSSRPAGLLATSTHDTKRGEDSRARLNVLSEIPGEWKTRLHLWSRFNRKKKESVEGQPAPDRNEELFIYQVLVGAWPRQAGAEESRAFRQRMDQYLIKALREAKVHTSWVNPNGSYEEAVLRFVERLLDPSADNAFLGDFTDFQKPVAHCGRLNSLSQTLLKIFSPGVPDFYQGSELWDLSLADPDNRRPVDYRLRRELLERIKRRLSAVGPLRLAGELAADMGDGAIKLYLIYTAMNHRRKHRALFERGAYLPLECAGERAPNVCAFSRRLEGEEALVVAPRFFSRLQCWPLGLPLGKGVWGETSLIVPGAGLRGRYRNIFTGEILRAPDGSAGGALPVADLLGRFPVAMLEPARP